MDLGLTDRSVIVTGGSSGIGLATARQFAAEGARLTICARGAERLEAARAALAADGAQVEAVVADVTDADDCARLIEAAVAAHGGIDVLVNNAGSFAWDRDPVARFRNSFDIHVLSALTMCELARPHLARSAGGGAVVNIASIWGRESGGGGDYNAAKSAQIAMTKALAGEWIGEGTRLNTIAPGSIAFDGGYWQNELERDPEAMGDFIARNIPGGRFGRAAEVANLVVFVASARASWLVGATVTVDGGQSRSNI
jgi:3-oxoacyl-[acyl-carrier protein] reductase